MKWMRYLLCAAAVCSIAGCGGKTDAVPSPEEINTQETVSMETGTDIGGGTEEDMEAEEGETLAEDENDTAVTVIGETAVDFEDNSAEETSVELTPEGSIIDDEAGVISQNVFQASDFSLRLPESWEGCCETSETTEGGVTYIAFYAKKCREEIPDGGWLFSVAAFLDDSYFELPSYKEIDMWEDVSYIAVYPTDVQFEGASKAAKRQYKKMAKAVDDILETFERTQFE